MEDWDISQKCIEAIVSLIDWYKDACEAQERSKDISRNIEKKENELLVALQDVREKLMDLINTAQGRIRLFNAIAKNCEPTEVDKTRYDRMTRENISTKEIYNLSCYEGAPFRAIVDTGVLLQLLERSVQDIPPPNKIFPGRPSTKESRDFVIREIDRCIRSDSDDMASLSNSERAGCIIEIIRAADIEPPKKKTIENILSQKAT